MAKYELVSWIIESSFFVLIFSNWLIVRLLKDKLEKKLLDLVSIISFLPGIPILWAWRSANVPDSYKVISFYIVLIFSIGLIISLMRRAYVYNKN